MTHYRLCCLIVLTCIVLSGMAMARNNGRYAQADPWFNKQMVPGTGRSCCSTADGVFAEEDIRKGNDGESHYWTRFVANFYDENNVPGEHEVDWMQVPDAAVIHDPNRHGSPVVWWYFEKSNWLIRCYAPGGGV